MSEELAILDKTNIGPEQRVNHAHIHNDTIVLHWHELETEPEEENGITLSREDWLRIMTSVYWKREETIEAEASSGNNLASAETHIGYVVFRYRSDRKRTADEEVALLSLQQVDARLRKRHR